MAPLMSDSNYRAICIPMFQLSDRAMLLRCDDAVNADSGEQIARRSSRVTAPRLKLSIVEAASDEEMSVDLRCGEPDKMMRGDGAE
jgi:hypothetical protein